MHAELKVQRLEVCKIATDTGYIRVVVCPSPRWYSQLCRKFEFPRKWPYRKHRTIIKRVDTLRTLARIATGVCNPDTAYCQRLLPYIMEWAGERAE